MSDKTKTEDRANEGSLHSVVMQRAVEAGWEMLAPGNGGEQLALGTWYGPRWGCESLDRVVEELRGITELIDRAHEMLSRADIMLDGWEDARQWHRDLTRYLERPHNAQR